MKKQEKNGKRSASVFGRFCSAIALCTIIVTLAAAALPIIALSVRSISDRPAAGAADEGSNIYSAERDGAVFRLHILANSDSTEDQRVKLAVRDAVIEYEREQTGAADAFDAADAESILRAHGDGILQTVRRTLKSAERNTMRSLPSANSVFRKNNTGKRSILRESIARCAYCSAKHAAKTGGV